LVVDEVTLPPSFIQQQLESGIPRCPLGR
jgi:hypothetical protein